jgi:hypothetical protein
MAELVWVLLFVAGLFVIEVWYLVHHELTISEHVQRLNARMGSQIFAGIFFLAGAIVGWFVCHFASLPPGG